MERAHSKSSSDLYCNYYALRCFACSWSNYFLLLLLQSQKHVRLVLQACIRLISILLFLKQVCNVLSELSSPANKERDIDVYVTVEADHEYEILDKYNQRHVKAPPPKPKPETKTAVQLQPLPSTGDYEFTQCPAYVSVTTTNVINASKPLEIPPPSQPGPLTPAQ